MSANLKDGKKDAAIHVLSLGHKPTPKPIAYPADYGLASATHQLIFQYGKDGAVNRLVEMAERIAAGEGEFDWVMRRRRVDPTERIISERKSK